MYPSAYTLYEWINSIDATGDKFTYIELPSVKKINLKVRMSNEGYSVERKLEILKQCFEWIEIIQDVDIDEKVHVR